MSEKIEGKKPFTLFPTLTPRPLAHLVAFRSTRHSLPLLPASLHPHTIRIICAILSIRSHFFPFTSMAMFIFFFYLFCCLLGVSCSFGEPTTGKRGENYINNDGVKLFHLFFCVAFLLCLSLISILKGGSMEVRETNSWRLFLRSPFLYSYPGTIPCTLYFLSLLFSLSELFKG